MAKARGDSLTGDLLAWEPPKVAAGFEPGAIRGNRLASQFSQVVALVLKSSNMSRAEIAAILSAKLQKKITEHMLDKYASEGSEIHDISAACLQALMEVTGCIAPLGFMGDRLDQIVVAREHASVITAAIEKRSMRDHRKQLDAREQALDAVLRGDNG